MSNIHPVQFKPPVNESLVEMLEDVLERARAGEIVSANISGTLANGEILTSYSSTDNAILEMAAVSRLLHRLQVRMDANQA